MESRSHITTPATGEPAAKRRCSAEAALRGMAEGLRCSITGSLLIDPVSAADGQIYEREAITRWLSNHATSPNTGAELASKSLVALPAVRTVVLQLVEAGALQDDEVREFLLQKGVMMTNEPPQGLCGATTSSASSYDPTRSRTPA